MRNKAAFKAELENLINKYSMENGSDTPDWILADHMSRCLRNFNLTVTARQMWYSRDTSDRNGGSDD